MKVYVLTSLDYDQSFIAGVYSTLELAQADAYPTKAYDRGWTGWVHSDGSNEWSLYDWAIDEFEVDAKDEERYPWDTSSQ